MINKESQRLDCTPCTRHWTHKPKTRDISLDTDSLKLFISEVDRVAIYATNCKVDAKLQILIPRGCSRKWKNFNVMALSHNLDTRASVQDKSFDVEFVSGTS